MPLTFSYLDMPSGRGAPSSPLQTNRANSNELIELKIVRLFISVELIWYEDEPKIFFSDAGKEKLCACAIYKTNQMNGKNTNRKFENILKKVKFEDEFSDKEVSYF